MNKSNDGSERRAIYVTMSAFDKSVLKYCLEHPDHPASQVLLKGFEESSARKKEEKRRWKLIHTALVHYEEVKEKEKEKKGELVA